MSPRARLSVLRPLALPKGPGKYRERPVDSGHQVPKNSTNFYSHWGAPSLRPAANPNETIIRRQSTILPVEWVEVLCWDCRAQQIGKEDHSASPSANKSRQARTGEPKRLISTHINRLRFLRSAIPAGSRMYSQSTRNSASRPKTKENRPSIISRLRVTKLRGR
jgi:hypothetical protein